MSDIQINKVWDYLLSNNELTSSLGNWVIGERATIKIRT